MVQATEIALVAEADAAVADLESDLHGRGWRTRRFSPETFSAVLSRDCRGLAVAVASDASQLARIIDIAREISLRGLPFRLVILQRFSNGAMVAPPPVASARVIVLHWPEERERLMQEVETHGRGSSPLVRLEDLSLEASLVRTLSEATPSLVPFADRLALAAKHDLTVLLTGETGTGKTYCARLLHDYSPRRGKRFLHVSCGAIAPNLLESEFFGHVRGAFTGAERDSPGKFDVVGDGTLLLDEIDTLSLKHQAALLRVLESGEYEPVGSVETKRCKARILVASNAPLEEAVADGRFRSDLYFRLNVMSFHFPPLRERLEDIEPLARTLAAEYSRKFDKEVWDFDEGALETLRTFPWPGNIRQLENAVQTAVLMCDTAVITVADLPEAVRHSRPPHAAVNGGALSLHQQRDLSERNAILKALVRNDYNRSRAAQDLGISRVTLYKKLEKYDLLDIPCRAEPRPV